MESPTAYSSTSQFAVLLVGMRLGHEFFNYALPALFLGQRQLTFGRLVKGLELRGPQAVKERLEALLKDADSVTYATSQLPLPAAEVVASSGTRCSLRSPLFVCDKAHGATVELLRKFPTCEEAFCVYLWKNDDDIPNTETRVGGEALRPVSSYRPTAPRVTLPPPASFASVAVHRPISASSDGITPEEINSRPLNLGILDTHHPELLQALACAANYGVPFRTRILWEVVEMFTRKFGLHPGHRRIDAVRVVQVGGRSFQICTPQLITLLLSHPAHKLSLKTFDNNRADLNRARGRIGDAMPTRLKDLLAKFFAPIDLSSLPTPTTSPYSWSLPNLHTACSGNFPAAEPA